MFEQSLREGKIGNLTLQNRFVMPGMGVNHNGKVDDVTIEWYAARAKGGYGLIVTEFHAVDELGKAVPGECLITDDASIPEFSRLPERIHQYGTKIFMQIHHAGRQTYPMLLNGQTPVSASSIACPTSRVPPNALTAEEVYDIIEKFGDAALRAKQAGFDGVEIHGGHGYLVTQFMSTYVNRRTDEFGGDLLGRAKFGVDIVRNVKETCGEDFPISFRLSGDERVEGGRQLQETVMLAKLRAGAGVDVFNMSTAVYATIPYMIAPYTMPPAYNIEAARTVRQAVKVPVIGVGRFNDPYAIASVIEDGLCDFVALGRTSIADPAFPNKVKSGNTDEISPLRGVPHPLSGYARLRP